MSGRSEQKRMYTILTNWPAWRQQITGNHQSRTGHRGAHCVKPRCYSSNLTESTNCRRRDRNVKQAWDRQPSHVAAPALRELVSFHTAEHIRDEIRRIDGSVHHIFRTILVAMVCICATVSQYRRLNNQKEASCRIYIYVFLLMILLVISYFQRNMFYALFALCQLAWFTITVCIGQLSVHVCALLSRSAVIC